MEAIIKIKVLIVLENLKIKYLNGTIDSKYQGIFLLFLYNHALFL